MLAGRMRCIDCRESWGGTWLTQATPNIICHLCGGRAYPEGPQRTRVAGENAFDCALFQLAISQLWRTMS